MATITERLATLESRVSAQRARIEQGRSARHTGAVPDRAPWGRKGQDPFSSQGFNLGRVASYYGGAITEDECKNELDFCRRFTREMERAGYRLSAKSGHGGHSKDAVLVPLFPHMLSPERTGPDLWKEMKSFWNSGVAGADPDELAHYQGLYGQKAAVSPAQSWVDQSAGAGFVAPPTFGPPIPLARNVETLMKTSTIVPLGPSGQIEFPRLTTATQGGWLGENTAQNPVNAGTGKLSLRAKKAFGVVVLPGELLRYGSPAAEAMIRQDLFTTVMLIGDKGLLDGQGNSNVPLGVVTAATAAGNPDGFGSVTLTNANQLSPQDVYKFIAAVEANNGLFSGWVMRPELFWALLETRATTYAGSGQVGAFVYNQFRVMQDEQGTKRLNGHRVITSAQVSQTRGSGAQSYVIGAVLEDMIVGMFGAVEMSQTDQGWTLFSADQVACRAILSMDGGVQHPAWWVVADAVNLTAGN